MIAANRNIDDLTPDTAVKCRLFLRLAKSQGLDVFVTETRRSAQRQSALWAIGRTQPGRKVTYAQAGTGKHEFGLAFDIAFKGANLYPNDAKVWARLGSIGKQCGLTWGGDFKSVVDSVHFENNGGIVMGDIEQGATDPVVKTAAVEVEKVPTLKSAKVAAVVTAVLALLPTIAIFVPAISPFIGAINAVARVFGYGA